MMVKTRTESSQMFWEHSRLPQLCSTIKSGRNHWKFFTNHTKVRNCAIELIIFAKRNASVPSEIKSNNRNAKIQRSWYDLFLFHEPKIAFTSLLRFQIAFWMPERIFTFVFASSQFHTVRVICDFTIRTNWNMQKRPSTMMKRPIPFWFRSIAMIRCKGNGARLFAKRFWSMNVHFSFPLLRIVKRRFLDIQKLGSLHVFDRARTYSTWFFQEKFELLLGI